MTVHHLGGHGYRLGRLRQQLNKGTEHIHGLFFDRLFPGASPNLRHAALVPANTALFQRGSETLKPSINYLDVSRSFLITSERRYQQLGRKEAKRFMPVLVLESRSQRARFWLDSKSRLLEFKGLTPYEFDVNRINPNSGQPQGLFSACPAMVEADGLKLMQALDTELTELGEFFPDLDDYSQILRCARDGERYYSWMRMDSPPRVYELLAQLEGLPLETFLYEAGQRFGLQLRRLHKAGRTLHDPFASSNEPKEPFFSTLHSGNVDPHGNIVDLEGLSNFDVAESRFWAALLSNNWGKYVPTEIMNDKLSRYPFDVFSRASDLQLFLGGRDGRFPYMPSVFDCLFRAARRPELFERVLAGVLDGYYQIEDPAQQAELKADLIRLIDNMKENNCVYFTFRQTLNIVLGIEAALG